MEFFIITYQRLYYHEQGLKLLLDITQLIHNRLLELDLLKFLIIEGKE